MVKDLLKKRKRPGERKGGEGKSDSIPMSCGVSQLLFHATVTSIHGRDSREFDIHIDGSGRRFSRPCTLIPCERRRAGKKHIVISFVVISITFGNSGTILPLLEIGLNMFVEGREIQHAAVLYVL